MKALQITLAILTLIGTVLVTLTAVVFCLGMGANSTPAEYRALKLWMLGLTLLGIGGVTGGILLLRAGRPGWSAIAGGTPAVIMVSILVVALLRR